MKIGLYFGSFNPIHVGHLIIANYMVEFTDLDQVWLVVTPHNPHKNKTSLLADHHRLEMVYLATKNYPKLKPSDVEFKLPQPNYTIQTLVHLSEKYPQHQFSILMGEDNLDSLHKWKNYEAILENYSMYIYPRKGTFTHENNLKNHKNIHRVEAPIIELSSTFIRQAIKDKKNIAPMLPDAVFEYLDHNLFYTK